MVEMIWAARPLDALVNNAAGNFIARTETLSGRAVDAILGVVLHGSAYVTLACGKRWLAAGQRATVLSMVTTYAWTGSAYVAPSAMAKAGVLAMTRSLAVEWGGRGIRLNAIAPGPFPTPGAWERLVPRPDLAREFETRNPLGRPGNHRELADLASFLLAEQTSYINGEVVKMLNDRYFLPLRRGGGVGSRLRSGRELPIRLSLCILLEEYARTRNIDFGNQKAAVE